MTHVNRADSLWLMVYTNLRNHIDCDALSPLDCLNKAARAWFEDAQALSPETCDIGTYTIVKSLFPSIYFRRTEEEPVVLDRPIVLVQFRADLFVLDGVRRLNKVASLGWNGIEALIIRPDLAKV